MLSEPEIQIFVNASAGSARNGTDALGQALDKAGITARIREVAPAGIADAIAAALRNGARTIGVAGGDGTLSTAAGLLAGTGAVLAPFPAGTLNHFARRLGLDDLETAAAALKAGRTLRVPIGVVGTASEVAQGGGRRFVNNASCGFYPHLVRHRERIRPWIGKWPAAAVAGVQVMLGLRRLRLTLDVPDATLHRRLPALWIGLGDGSFSLPSEDEVKPAARQLEIVLPHASTRSAFVGVGLRVLWRLFRGERPDPAEIEIVHAPTMMLDARHPVDIALDGEPLRLRPPIQFAILPAALEVVAAAPTAGRAAPAPVRAG